MPVQTGKFYNNQIRFIQSSLALERIVGLNIWVSGTKLIAKFFLAAGGDLGDTEIEGFLNDQIYATDCI